MENYLLELIRENNRIIIPNFGAFIVSREKGQNILFNNFLSFNDGLLISHICAVEGVDSAIAAQKVDNYVAHINNTLDEKGLFEIDGIGRFTKDDSGVLRFEQAVSDFAEIDEGRDEDGLTSEEEKPVGSSDDNDLLDLETSGYEELPLKPVPTDDNRSYRRPEETAPYPARSASANIPFVKEIDNSTDVVSEPPAAKGHVYVDKAESNRPVGIIILVLLILLLLIGSTLWFFTGVFDDFKNREKLQPFGTEQVEVPETQDEIQANEEAGFVEEVLVEEPAVVSTRQHHVIVGSFRDESKAKEQMNTFIGKGYERAAILPYEGRYLLSVEWHSSVNKALQRQEELLKELQMENWVLSLTVK